MRRLSVFGFSFYKSLGNRLALLRASRRRALTKRGRFVYHNAVAFQGGLKHPEQAKPMSAAGERARRLTRFWRAVLSAVPPSANTFVFKKVYDRQMFYNNLPKQSNIELALAGRPVHTCCIAAAQYRTFGLSPLGTGRRPSANPADQGTMIQILAQKHRLLCR